MTIQTKSPRTNGVVQAKSLDNIPKFKDFISYSSEQEYLNDKECINAHLVMGYALKDTLSFRSKSQEKPYFTIGKLVEDLIFHKDLVNSKYLIISNYQSEHTQKLNEIITNLSLLELSPKDFVLSLQNTEEGHRMLLTLVSENELFKTIKLKETLLAKLKKEDFFERLINRLENSDKLVVTTSDYELASALANNIRNSKATKNIFKNENKENVEFIDQFRIKVPDIFKKGWWAKIAVDLLVVDHNSGQVFFYDIKTDRHSTHEFIAESYFTYRLDLQMDFYHYVLSQFIATKFPNYGLNSGRIIVVSKTYVEQEATIYNKPPNNLLVGRELDPSLNIPKNYTDLRTLLSDISNLTVYCGGKIENLPNLNQTADYYLVNNFITLPI